MKKIKSRVALGLSGGVDSAVSAYLLKQHGYDVHCIYMNCYDADIPDCRAKEDRQDALAVALHLGLPFQVLDFRKEYQKAVIDYFKNEYLAGRTPNPDVVCNREIKFGLFLEWAIKAGFDAIATGHYAKMATMAEMAKNGYNHSNHSNHFDHFLLRPVDEHKDQTYFLWAVQREKFKHVLFPLGNLLKSEVREIAKKIKLPVARKKDSTGICFVGEVRVEDFLKKLGVKEKIGEVVIRTPLSFPRRPASTQRGERESIQIIDIDSGSKPGMTKHTYEVVGRHKGVWFYTIGQRHGFEIFNFSGRAGSRSAGQFSNSKQGDRPPLYVIEKDIKNNRLVVGFGAECYRDSFEVRDLNWLAPEVASSLPWSTSTRRKSATSGLRRPPFGGLLVRIRHGGELIPCSITNVERRTSNVDQRTMHNVQRATLMVHLAAPARGIAAGQSAVFYLPGSPWRNASAKPGRSGAKAGAKNGIVLGGGVIQ